MKTTLRIGTIVLAIIAATVSYAQPTPPHNGYWWQEQSAEMRLGYVIGYVDESTEAMSLVHSALAMHTQQSKTNAQLGELFGKSANEILDFSDIAHGQFVDGLNDFYKDYRNTKIHVDDAMLYVRDQIKGVDKKELVTELTLLRKTSTSPGYDQ